MKLNTNQTKIMVLWKKRNKKIKLIIKGDEIKQAKQLQYLGRVITDDGQCDQKKRL
jgi:hypothetical protein